MEEQTGQKPARRRTFLVDRHFQLKYTSIIVLVGVIVSGLLGIFIYRQSMENTTLIGLDAELQGKVAAQDLHAILYLVGFVAVMALFLFVWGIFITHRVAGPIYIISRYLRQIADNQVPHTRPLRKGDELKEFFDTFSAMLSSLKKQNSDEAEQLKTCIGELKASGGEKNLAVAQKLDSILVQKAPWLKP